MFKDTRGRGFYDIFGEYLVKGQINLSISYPGTIRAFHRHKKQWDSWYVVSGHIEAALYDEDEDRFWTVYLSEGEETVLRIKPGVWHGFKVLGNTEAKLLYYVTERFDPNEPDEERAPWNAFYNWETEKK